MKHYHKKVVLPQPHCSLTDRHAKCMYGIFKQDKYLKHTAPPLKKWLMNNNIKVLECLF